MKLINGKYLQLIGPVSIEFNYCYEDKYFQSGLEILVLITIIKLNRDWSNQLQILAIDKLHVKITNNKRKKIYDRFLSKFLIQEKNGAKVILLQSNKEQIEIGRFLTTDEKDELIAILKRKVHELNFS